MKGRLLVVDDETIARQSLTDILILEGYDVSAVKNGLEAIDYLRAHDVDLMVLDLRMPGMSGMDVIQAASQISPDTEIVLLTAYGSMETAVDALRQRVHDYLLKPASPTQILNSVEHGLSRRSAKTAQSLLNDQDASENHREMFLLSDGTEVDTYKRLVTRSQHEIRLTGFESRFLSAIMNYPGKVFTYRDLVLRIKGTSVSDKQAQDILRPLISRMKNKLEPFPLITKSVISVRGVGYSYRENS